MVVVVVAVVIVVVLVAVCLSICPSASLKMKLFCESCSIFEVLRGSKHSNSARFPQSNSARLPSIMET